MYILGFDIGGTKCAVMTALWDGNEIKLEKKQPQIIADEKPVITLETKIEQAIEKAPQETYKKKVQETLEDERIFRVKERPVVFHSPVSNPNP